MRKLVLVVLGLLISCNLLAVANGQTGDNPAPAFKLSPQELDATLRRAEDLIRTKSYRKAIEEYQKVLATDSGHLLALYNTACVYSLLNEKAKAIEFLGKTVEAGWTDSAHLQSDADLNNIRSEAGYKDVLKTLLERPAKLKAVSEEGAALLEAKKYDEAAAKFREADKLQPNNHETLFMLAHTLALGGNTDAALDAIEAAFRAGFADIPRFRRDNAFDAMRQMERYRVFAQTLVDAFKRRAQSKVDSAKKQLMDVGCDPKRYKTVFDIEHNMVYFSAWPDREVAAMSKKFADFADFQWKSLLKKNPQQLLCIVLMTTEDMHKTTAKQTGGINGSAWYISATDFLWVGNDPMYEKLHMDIALHEYVHALLTGDFRARGLGDPERWFNEGMATLFESSDRVGDEWVPRDNTVRRNWLNNGFNLWDGFMSSASSQLYTVPDVKNVQTAYAEGRYILFFINERGLLKKFFDRYTNNLQIQKNKPAREAIEFVFGKSLEQVQADWADWLKHPELFGQKPDLQTTLQRADDFIRNQNYPKAIEEYGKVLAIEPNHLAALYNTACAYALQKEKAKSIEFLKKAVAAGWTDIAHLESDSDLDAVREEAGYKGLLKNLKERVEPDKEN